MTSGGFMKRSLAKCAILPSQWLLIGLITFIFLPRFTHSQEAAYIPLIEFRDFIRELAEPHAQLHLSFTEISYHIAETQEHGSFGKMIQGKLIQLAGSVEKVTASTAGNQPKLAAEVPHYRIEGNYWEAEAKIHLKLCFIPAATPSVLFRKSCALVLERPRNEEILSNDAVKNTFRHFATIYNPQAPFKVQLTTSVEPGGKIVIGKPVTIHITASVDCYFVLMNRDAGGHIEVIFPRTNENNWLAAGVKRTFDDLTLQEPFGLEVLFLYASQQPIQPEAALKYFSEYYHKHISQLFADRAITRKDLVVDWTYLYSIAPQ
jgi:hypothetical protein